ncbi:MAG: hypothetical protein LGB54_01255 [Sulfurovum sp.]|nr:hypothetical protein [Sulfurovum sp.]MCB4759229.1 hypothetical protein [Sulfurovum sp.]
MQKILIIFITLSTLIYAKISTTGQLLVVTTKGWNDNNGILQRYEKDAQGWHKVGKVIYIKLGHNGLGWGRGLHTIPKDAIYIKKEGDGRSPAGIFSLKQAFGYAPFNANYPYSIYKETDHCVDDVHSRFYNKIIDSTKINMDYTSKEYMKFPKNYYKYGIVVNHNHIDETGAIPGAGSCIFIHIKEVPTTGCTVMKEKEIKEIIWWLEARKHPLLIQGTKETVERLWKQI